MLKLHRKNFLFFFFSFFIGCFCTILLFGIQKALWYGFFNFGVMLKFWFLVAHFFPLLMPDNLSIVQKILPVFYWSCCSNSFKKRFLNFLSDFIFTILIIRLRFDCEFWINIKFSIRIVNNRKWVFSKWFINDWETIGWLLLRIINNLEAFSRTLNINFFKFFRIIINFCFFKFVLSMVKLFILNHLIHVHDCVSLVLHMSLATFVITKYLFTVKAFAVYQNSFANVL